MILIAASDETSGKDTDSVCTYAGYVATEQMWDRFAAKWEKWVLSGPPSIPYLHMTQLRSRSWRARYGITDADALRREVEAVRIIRGLKRLYPVAASMSGVQFKQNVRNRFEDVPRRRGALGVKDPDYLCFIGYIKTVLALSARLDVNVHRVDLVVERNGKVTNYLADFYEYIRRALRTIAPQQAELMGALVPAEKSDIRLQAAEILCWHQQRGDAGMLTPRESKSFGHLTEQRPGRRWKWEDLGPLADAVRNAVAEATARGASTEET